MNKFEKVSAEQYLKDIGLHGKLLDWEELKLPKRATKFSAGYDFFAPFDFEINPGDDIKIPTGIKVRLDNDKVLMCMPRSSIGFKYKMRLANTVGIIDKDYHNNKDNEGHIFAKLVNGGDKVISVKRGDAFMQGIIVQYFITEDDNTKDMRNGGIGSTGA